MKDGATGRDDLERENRELRAQLGQLAVRLEEAEHVLQSVCDGSLDELAVKNSALQSCVARFRSREEEIATQNEELRQQNDEILRTTAALEAERMRYRDLFESAPVGYLVTARA